MMRIFMVLLLAAMLSACATAQNNHDPIEPVNRVTDKVNDGIDRVTLKPMAQGYTAVVPKPMRTAVSNFYDNATYLNTVLNDFLQGKGGQGFEDLLRFIINSTLGIGGLVDVATSMGLERHEEDFGQTLAVWGFDQGAYLVYPLLGPNSVRDTPGFLTETATDPLFWASLAVAPVVTIPLTVLKYVDKRARLLDASEMRDEVALDPYLFTREAWKQNREYLIHDGNPPKKPASGSDDGWEEDEWGEKQDDGWEEDEFDTAAPVEPTLPTEPKLAEQSKQPEIKAEEPVREESEDGPKTRISMAAVATSASEAAAADLASEDRVDEAMLASTPSSPEAAYTINIVSYLTEIEAVAAQAGLARKGVNSKIREVMVNDQHWYRLVLNRKVSANEARAVLADVRELSGIQDAWLSED